MYASFVKAHEQVNEIFLDDFLSILEMKLHYIIFTEREL